MSEMPIEGTVHAERLSSHNALGARGDPRGDATSARSQAAGDDVATTHHRTCVWDAEALDGLNALPHARTGTCRHRDELARPCLQPQATDQFAWHSEDDQSNEVTRRLTGGLTACRSRSRRSIHRTGNVAPVIDAGHYRVSTQPRPQPEVAKRATKAD